MQTTKTQGRFTALQTWRLPVVCLCLLVLLTVSGARALTGFAKASDPVALVRVEISAPQDLEALAATGMQYYVQLYAADGDMFLLAPANVHQQEDLQQKGFALHQIDSDVSTADYYLLSGLPEALQQASTVTNILFVEGRQAVARATPEQATRVSNLGIRTLPLWPRPLTAPAAAIPQAANAPSAVTPDTFVREMIAKVDRNTLYQYDGDLSGEWQVTIGGSPITLSTRYSYATNYINKATRYARDHFLALGIPAGFHDYSLSGTAMRNVVAEQTGLTQPERIFLVTAHIDSVQYNSNNPSSYSLAPGADDNASGTAGVMHVADILSQYPFGCTLRYVLFTGEEQGLYGSYYYADYVHSQGDQI